MMNILIALSENDKRLIFALLLVFIIAIVFIGLLGYALFKLLKWQSKKLDALVHDVVVTKTITERKPFLKYARYKNWALFFKQSWIPMIILIFDFIILIIHNSITHNWAWNPFSTYDGFGTIFYTWKPSGEYTDGVYIKFAKLIVDNYPHLIDIAWAGYIFGPCFLVGGTWYVIVVACLFARTILMYIRSRKLFVKSLADYKPGEDNNAETNEVK